MVEDIKVKFVIPEECSDESSCSQEMQQAFLTCEQHRGGGLQPQWIHEKYCKDLDGLTKKDVFVLNEFKGPLFEILRSSKCLLVGPRCLSCCLTEGVSIPSGVEPMFTVAMRGLIITASGFSKPQKDNIRQKVQWMGGTYTVMLTADTTHLVSDTVLSDKYIKSVEKGIPVMNESWIEDVWQSSLQLNINGASEQFNKHLLLPFANLQVTTSSIGRKEKLKIMKLVNEHGGVFCGAFQSETTDVVVLNRDGITSEKYRAAVEHNIPCVLPAWVFDSAKKGVALPMKRYTVLGATTSSPLTTQHRLPDMSLNFSRITNIRPASNFVDETRNTDISNISTKLKSTQDSKLSESSVLREIVAAFENLDMDEIKKAGPILDGYCILVCGPPGPWRDRASSAVVRAGGVRLESDHPRLTHVLTTSYSYVKHMSLAVPVLSPMWLIETLKKGKPADEREYLVDENSKLEPRSSQKQRLEPASPMSKRNLLLLRPPETPKTPNKSDPPVHEAPEDLLHYLSQQQEPSREITPEKRTVPENVERRPDDTEFTQDDPTEDIEQIFQGITIEVQDLEEDALCSVSAEVSAVGGILTRAGGGGQYCVVPLDFDVKHLKNKNAEAITVFWIKDCLTQQEVVPVQYYHRPVSISEKATTCLNGVVLSLSTYVGMERAFLDELAKLLGATTQLRFCRRTTPVALASTHLLCPTAVGDKYIGAVKWGLPAVTGDWILDTAVKGERLYEGPYLVGDTKAPIPPPKENNKSSLDETTKDLSNAQTDMDPPANTSVARKQSISNNQPIPNNSRENTPRGKQQGNEDDMSPASRYIAMARQGLLGTDTQETPKRVNELKEQSTTENDSAIRTPPLEDALSTPNLMMLSPTTRRRLIAVKKGEMPSDPIATPTDPFRQGPETPDSGFGAALRPGTGRLSPHSRKRLWSFVQALPEKQQEKSTATPLSEVKNRFLAQFNSDSPLQADHNLAPRKLNLQDRVETPPIKKSRISEKQHDREPKENMPEDQMSASNGFKSLSASVDAQLQQLCATLNNRSCSPAQRLRRQKDSLAKTDNKALEPEPMSGSQPNTVGWDDSTGVPTQKLPAIKRFTLSSNVDNSGEVISMLQSLGGELCAESSEIAEWSHLLCAAVSRSEKMLVSLAAGKWVLHPAYILESHKAGTFLNEEEYEWGNELATCLPSLSASERDLANAVHKWRVTRQNGEHGPYHNVVALLHLPLPRKKLLAKLLKAGGGKVIDAEPPYTNASLSNITICLADVRRHPLSESDAKLIKSMSVPVCPPLLLSNYLTDAVTPDPRDHCLPEFKV